MIRVKEGYQDMQFSKRLDLFGDEIFAALNERKVELEAQGRTIYNPVSYTHLDVYKRQGRGRHRIFKSHPAVYGVCGHWIRKRKSFLPLPASGALYKPGLPC